MNYCGHCKRHKPDDKFYHHKNGKPYSWCIRCHNRRKFRRTNAVETLTRWATPMGVAPGGVAPYQPGGWHTGGVSRGDD